MTTVEKTTTGLVLTAVSLRFGDGDSTVLALDNVNLEVSCGELVAIVGPSGAGKSSLLAVAGGLGRPSSGTIVIDGVDVSTLNVRAFRSLFGFVGMLVAVPVAAAIGVFARFGIQQYHASLLYKGYAGRAQPPEDEAAE